MLLPPVWRPGLFLTSATASGPASGPNAVTAWNANAGEATIAACFLGGFAPQEARMYAMMHVAIHDALNGDRPSLATLRREPSRGTRGLAGGRDRCSCA